MKNAIINLKYILIPLQLLARMIFPQMLHKSLNPPAHRVRFSEPRAEDTCESPAFLMTLDHEAILDQEPMAFVHVPVPTVRDDLPRLTRPHGVVRVAVRAHAVAAHFVTIRQIEAGMFLEVAGVDAEYLVIVRLVW